MNYSQLLFPDFSLIAVGFLVCNFTALNRHVWQPVEGLVYYLLFPVLLFHSVVKSPIDIAAAGHLLGAGILLTLGGIGASYLLPLLPGLRSRIDRREHAGGAQIAFRFSSFIALALTERLAGAPGMLLIAMLVGVCVPIVNVGAVWPMARHGGQGLLRELARNPLILATAAGLVANALGFHIPSWLEPSITKIGSASLPLGLMATGAGLQFHALAKSRALSVGLLSIRHLVLPLLGFVLARLFALDALQTTVLIIFASVPTASSCYVLAARMGYNGGYVAALVTLSTVLGLLSLPLALAVLR